MPYWLRDTLIRTPLITPVVLGMTKASGYDWLKVLLSITQLEFEYYCYETVTNQDSKSDCLSGPFACHGVWLDRQRANPWRGERSFY